MLLPRPLKVSLRSVATACALLAGIALFLAVAHQTYPIQHWLFWVYARIWLATLFFGATCLCAGHGLLIAILKRTLPLLEHLAIAFALGVFVFYLMVFAAGLLGLLHPALFFAGPLLLALPGARAAGRFARRVFVHLSAARQRARLRPAIWPVLILIAGCVAVAALYFPILTPENVAYDARWYHLPLAEHYVAQGAVRRFPEGWFFGAYPHLASFLYAWAMLLPGGSYFDCVELCAHVEFLIFLATLVGVVALARHLLPGRRLHLAWVAIFLFPEIFIYDSSLTVGADHIAALWAPPILILFWRTVRSSSPRFAGLLAVMMAGALCTKTTALLIVAFPALALAAWCLWGALAPGGEPSAKRARLKILAVAAAVGVVCTAPHWLKNWLWYGDPIYPMLRAYLTPRPGTPDFAIPLDNWFFPPDHHPPRTWKGLAETLGALFTYSFIPRDWPIFHRSLPIFGSLSTLALLYLPFLRGTRRIWFAYAAIHSGIFLWYSLHHFDRYLQALLPWMAAALAALFVLLWAQGRLTRVALAVVVACQLVWAGDVYFFPQHAMTGSAIKKSIDLLGAGFTKNFQQRFVTAFGQAPEMGSRLALTDKVLIHEQHGHWAWRRMSVSDWQGTQGGISYVRAGNLGGVFNLFKQLGVTHLHFSASTSHGYDTLGGDLLFFTFARMVAQGHESFGGFTLARLPAAAERELKNDVVAFFGCANSADYHDGLYRVGTMTASDLDPRHVYPEPFRAVPRELPDGEVEQILSEASFAVVDPSCHAALPLRVETAGFTSLVQRKNLRLFARAPVAARP